MPKTGGEHDLGFWFLPPYPLRKGTKSGIAANVLRVYEPVARAKRLRLFFATAVTEREGWATGQTCEGTAVVQTSAVTEQGWTEPQATTNGRSAA